MAKTVRRGSYRVFIGEGDERWSLADPCHPIVRMAAQSARQSELLSPVLALTSVVSDMAYLVYDCPTTLLACQKLAAMRVAVRKLGPVEEE